MGCHIAGSWTPELPKDRVWSPQATHEWLAVGLQTQSKLGHSAAAGKDRGTEVSPRGFGSAPNIRSSVLG